ncbi:uncharacterized protein LOC135847504 [Planococcus citri]|uniref:uncharacterized protein LOC135847504 n=1 Tax=Planococcus citri TaxID=170843 RepID=UPI0031F9965D
MAGINSEVYDVFHPNPVSLKDLPAMAVSLGIWRCEVMKYRSSDDTLTRFNPEVQNISSNTVLPHLPSVIRATIDRYLTNFRFSLGQWLHSHHERVFHFHYNHQNHVLRYFDDFVCDYNGTIHYVKTAERMMHCDQFDVQQKFIIACTYFFEDDIRRLWPLVSSNMDLNSINFSVSPQLYYWICYLKKRLDKIPISRWDNCVENVMLTRTMTHNRPSVEYFWNRIPTESRVQKGYDLFHSDVQSFARYIFPKLDDQQLDNFVNVGEYGFELMRALCLNSWYDKEFIHSIWMRIRNVINQTAFTNGIIIALQFENGEYISMLGISYYEDYKDDKDGCIRRNWFNMCCEIWNSAPERLKRSAVEEITSNYRLFEGLQTLSSSIPPEPKEYVFFSTFLSYATYEERKTFWSDCWRRLIQGTRCQDFKKLMNLCFENEDEITQFRENVMANNDNGIIFYICESYLLEFCFDEVNEFVSLSRPDTQAARNFKQQILQSVFFGELRYFREIEVMIRRPRELNEFINDAYNDTDMSWNFKNQLVCSPVLLQILPCSAFSVPIELFKEFIDLFVSSKDIVLQIKTGIIDFVKKVADLKTTVSESSLTSLLSWCLENDEEFMEFK